MGSQEEKHYSKNMKVIGNTKSIELRNYLLKKIAMNMTKSVMPVELGWLKSYDESLSNLFLSKPEEFMHDLYLIIEDIRRNTMIESDFILNMLPSDSMPFKYISSLSHYDDGKAFRMRGGLQIGERWVDQHYRVSCKECKSVYMSKKKLSHCVICKKFLNDNITKIAKTYNDLLFEENYPNKTQNLGMVARVQIYQDISILNIEEAISKPVDIIGRIELIPVGKSHKFLLHIIGIKYQSTKTLTQEQRDKCKEFIESNSGNVLNILADNIFRNHVFDDYIKKAMIICAIGLNPKDKTLPPTVSKQMVFQWISLLGKGKSTLMQVLKKYFDRAGFLGKDQTRAGVDGSIVKNELGQFIFKAGELLRCNGGVLFCDEIGMWNEEDLNTLSSAISEQKVVIKKVISQEFDIFLNFVMSGNTPSATFDLQTKTYFEHLGGTPQINDRCTVQIVDDYEEANTSNISKIYDYATGYKQKEQTLEDEFIRHLIIYIKEQPNTIIGMEIHRQMKVLAIQLNTAKYTKNGLLNEYETDKEKNLRVKKFRTRQFIDMHKFLKAYGRIEGHAEATQEDLINAWEIMSKASYENLLKDYGDTDVQLPWAKQAQQIKSGDTKPSNRSELKRWIHKKVLQQPNKTWTFTALEKQFKEWNILEDSDALIQEMYYRNKMIEFIDKDKFGIY